MRKEKQHRHEQNFRFFHAFIWLNLYLSPLRRQPNKTRDITHENIHAEEHRHGKRFGVGNVVTALEFKRCCAATSDDEVGVVGQINDMARREQHGSMPALSSFGGPADRSGFCVERNELALLPCGVAVDHALGIHWRAHIHRYLRVLPYFSYFPLAVVLLERISMGA